ncbi:MAG TPA: C-GCAxxG-C-C family protein [Candidatus Limiplasma sp.]|nr:C-GCAxxG-C-C family protein [Candidatus Limiplasma sp.]HPS80639.1 C-GCAxxG-C-C family protein [Candidatus Limiplasma sp.]
MSESIKAKQARDYFNLGFNCAQSVFTAFHEEMGLSESEALRISSSMGGGIGGLREVCGAFCGMSMALGALLGYDSPTDMEAKKAHYARIQQKGAEFSEAFGTLICRDLLASHDIVATPAPAERNAEYYKARPCARYVEACARMAEEELAKNNL